MAKKIKATDEKTMEAPEKMADANIFHQDGQLVVDVFETNEEFVVLAAIAGVQIKDLDISVEKEMMIIKGDRQDPHEDPTNPSTSLRARKFFAQECYWGPFSRKIVLHENIDTNAAKAEINKGLLTIKIPKTDGTSIKTKVEVS